MMPPGQSSSRSISFGKGTYEEEKHGWWPEEIKPGWIVDLPMGISFKDGRYLEAKVDEGFVKFYAVDEFGTVGVTPEEIAYMDFITDLTEETQAPPVTDAVATEAPGAVSGHPEFSLARHAWGDWEPQGTVKVTMKDGTEHTGVANSFLMVTAMMTSDLFKTSERFFQGFGSAAPDQDPDEIPLTNFLETVSITSGADGMVTVDDAGNTKVYSLPEDAEFWFISGDSLGTGQAQGG